MKGGNRAELGRLITAQLFVRGVSANEFAREHFPGNRARSFYNWKGGHTAPATGGARRLLENALGWKHGTVMAILAAPAERRFELAELTGDPAPGRAAGLSTMELLSELTRRTLEMERGMNELLKE
jgi:hypothetical protein